MGKSKHNIIGKVSIGTPIKEPMPLSEEMIGKKAARASKRLGIRKGKKIEKSDLKRMHRKGVEEYFVIRGRAPDQLDNFRLLRRSDEYKGEFVEDKGLLEKYELGKDPTSIPIVFPVGDKDRIFVDNMRNWDAQNSKMYCRSDDGETATRKVVENGNYTGKSKEIECIPNYGDDRGQICPFRDHNSKLHDKMPCKYRVRLFFNILTKESSTFNLGSFFKFESSSTNTGQQIEESLDDMIDHFGTLAFIPCELQLKFDKRTTPDGHTTEQPSVALSIDMGLLEEYRETISNIKSVIDTYSVDIEIEDDTSEEAVDSEFRPDVERRKLESEGLLDKEGEAEEDDITSDVNTLHLAEDPTFEEKLQHINALALQLPKDRYESFKSKRGNLTPENIDGYIKNTKNFLRNNFTQEERRENADAKSEGETA